MSYYIKRKPERQGKCLECGNLTNGYYHTKRLCGNCLNKMKQGNRLIYFSEKR